jgi:thiamine biosynthesis lipoprotein
MDTFVLRQEQNHMATTFDFQVSCDESELPRADRLLLRAHDLVSRLECELSEYLPESPVYQLNQAKSFECVRFTEHGLRLIEKSHQLSKLSKNAFNPLAKSEAGLHEPYPLRWDSRTGEAWKTLPGVHLGFGAIGKGYALDQVRLLLEQENFQDFLLSAGGSSIILSGFEAPRKPWSWGWSWKKGNQGENLGLRFTHSSGKAIALGISGTHEKGDHILGAPGSGVLSALVAHSSATEADALSTAFYVSGWDRGLEYLSEISPSPAVAMIESSEVPRWNGTFQKLWHGLETASNFKNDSFWTRLAGQALFLGALALISFHSIPACIADDATIDLTALDGAANSFTPYLLERNQAWILLPLFALAMVLLHLKKTKARPKKRILLTPSIKISEGETK